MGGFPSMEFVVATLVALTLREPGLFSSKRHCNLWHPMVI
jgi:hypothetical protein